MSVSIGTYLILGCKISKKELAKKTLIRGCNHKERNAKFCPECGEPMFKEIYKSIFSEKDEDMIYNNEIGAISIIESYERCDNYLGINLSFLYSDSNKIDKEIDLSKIEDYKLKIERFLEKYSLNKEIKLYHILLIN